MKFEGQLWVPISLEFLMIETDAESITSENHDAWNPDRKGRRRTT